MTYRCSGPQIAGKAPTDSGATPVWQVGIEQPVVDEVYGAGIAKYMKATVAFTYGQWGLMTEDNNEVALLTTAQTGQVGIAMAAIAAGSYGWFQICGKAIGLCLAGYLDNALVYATTTAGSVDDAVVGNSRVKKALGASAIGVPSGSFAEFEIDRPFMDNGAAT